jgi:hypothetical protein
MSKRPTTRSTTPSSLTLIDSPKNPKFLDKEPKTASEKQRQFLEDFNMEHSDLYAGIRVRAFTDQAVSEMIEQGATGRTSSRSSFSPSCVYLG